MAPSSGPASPAPGGRRGPVWEDYRRAERFGSREMSRLVFKTSVRPHWIGRGPRFWYRNDVRGEREFILADPAKAARKLAFDHARLAAALSEATGRRYRPKRLPFRTIELTGEGRFVEFHVGGLRWRCDLRSYACRKADPASKPSATKPRSRPASPRKRPRGESPDGRYVALVRDHNLYVKAKANGREIQLSRDGSAEKAYGRPSWSPDSERIVAFRTRPGANRTMHLIESSPNGQLRPKPHSHVYALPGDKLPVHEMWVFDAEARKPTRVRTEPIDWGGPPELHWRGDKRHFLFEQTHRGYQRVRIIEVDSVTGKARTLIDERSNTFLPPQKKYVRYVDRGRRIVWASERDGWNHLYLYDGRTGKLINRITTGKWPVRAVQRVDEKARQIWFTAGGREPGRDPYLVHYYRVNFDGSGLVCLTPGNGTHRVTYSPDGGYLIDTYSRVDLAPVTELRRVRDGSLVCVLEKADVRSLLATGWRWPEPFVSKGRDGKTDIHGVIYRPSNLDESSKYPVIESIYAGPQGSFVPKAFHVRSGARELAELGFLVVRIDGMGTSNRSKAFHDVCYRNLGDGGFPDRIAWLRAAAKRYRYVDLGRVGIYGSSAGGYNAARALLAWPEFYKVAVSLSGNHDHRTDKTWWNELWMGYPVGDHYRQQSNVTNAHKLRGELLLIHGELDRNVNPHASTMQFVSALIRANRDFDLLIVPGQGHGFRGGYVKRRLWDYFVRHLRGIEPPKGYRLRGPAGTGRRCTITIRNRTRAAVSIHWIDFEGGLKKYHDLAPGGEVRQNTYDGHEWVAQVHGETVSTYTASARRPVWEIVDGRRREEHRQDGEKR